MSRVTIRVIAEAGALDESRELAFVDKDEITIGRATDNDVVMHGDLVSRRHAKLTTRPGRVIVTDLQSENGVFIRGRRISSPVILKEPVPVTIGNYRLEIELAE